MSIGERTDQLVADLLSAPDASRTILLDAAALTSARDLEELIAAHDGHVILTPHHGEMAHLSGLEVEAVKRSEEHTSELQSLMRISYAVFCLKKKKTSRQGITVSIPHQHTRNTLSNYPTTLAAPMTSSS